MWGELCRILYFALQLSELKSTHDFTSQGVPLLYVPLEVVMSEFYGKSERLLGKVFSLANDLPNGAIIFLDEVMKQKMLTRSFHGPLLISHLFLKYCLCSLWNTD